MTEPTGARYEIAIDGTTRTHREDLAREAATVLKTRQPIAEITVRDLQTGTVVVIKHPASR
jgi:hypothetical protein